LIKFGYKTILSSIKKGILYKNIWKMLSAHKQMVFIARLRQAKPHLHRCWLKISIGFAGVVVRYNFLKKGTMIEVLQKPAEIQGRQSWSCSHTPV